MTYRRCLSDAHSIGLATGPGSACASGRIAGEMSFVTASRTTPSTKNGAFETIFTSAARRPLEAMDTCMSLIGLGDNLGAGKAKDNVFVTAILRDVLLTPYRTLQQALCGDIGCL